MAKPNDGQITYGGINSGKRLYGFRSGGNILKSPTEVLQHVIFNYSAGNNNNKVLVENVKRLSQNIAVSGAIRYDAPKVAYTLRTLTAP